MLSSFSTPKHQLLSVILETRSSDYSYLEDVIKKIHVFQRAISAANTVAKSEDNVLRTGMSFETLSPQN
jgi:hypothetical protein